MALVKQMNTESKEDTDEQLTKDRQTMNARHNKEQKSLRSHRQKYWRAKIILKFTQKNIQM